jgi:hypothetical protein
MSDTGRQSFTDKASSAMKPDSQKGTFEQASDKIKGTMDSAAGSMQPNVSIPLQSLSVLSNIYALQLEPEIWQPEDG